MLYNKSDSSSCLLDHHIFKDTLKIGQCPVCHLQVMAVGVSSPKLSLLATDGGIKLILAPESYGAFLMSAFPIIQGIMKLPRSCLFSRMDLKDPDPD